MTHVITRSCCNDASCVPVCPVGCIHPEPGTPAFANAEMLHIDPATCIDCGVCVSACPVGAIVPDDALTGAAVLFRDINAEYFRASPIRAALDLVSIEPPPRPSGNGRLRVAIVGSGPAGSYAALELLRYPNVDVNVFERLPTPWGLVRAGVAPDHQATKSVATLFERGADDSRVRFFLNVEVGTDVTPAELSAHHHAVIYAHGASLDRRLGIPNEDLPGSISATEFVNWYNGHPDVAGRTYDLSTKRAVVIGNGNVALDIARLLVSDPEALASTDMADHAIAAFRASTVQEVVVLGRRGPREAAFSTPELAALSDLAGVDVLVEPSGRELLVSPPGTDPTPKERLVLERLGQSAARGNRRIILRFYASPAEIVGDDRVRGLRVARTHLEVTPGQGTRAVATDETSFLEAGLILRSIGYRGRAIAGLPFDDELGVIPNDRGRVIDEGIAVPGSYATGWIKRGARGVIGTNRECAKQTVTILIADHEAGLLPTPSSDQRGLDQLVSERRADATDLAGWRSIDRVERARGISTGAPRRKLTDRRDLVAAARSGKAHKE
ncbi:FAD-dependent oxidoreductase [Streptomyces europaeiscabiei]|uniref:FAD-dependent oxidoreductase n=1 Tax=Streptomyces europaeiscabiei TaxID=146819 RepID=UPI002E18E28C